MPTLAASANLGDPSLTVSQALCRWAADLRQHARLIRSLFRRLYWNRFKGSALGFFWVFVMPCIPLVIYTSLQYLGVFNTTTADLPRALYTGWGILYFLIFAETLRYTTGTLVTHRRDILQTGIPKMALLAVAALQALGDFVMRFLAFLAVMLLCGIRAHDWLLYFHPWLLLAPVFALALASLAFSLGCVLSLVMVYYRDLLNFLTAALSYLFFASGVFIVVPANTINLFYFVLRWQPLYLVIEQSRQLCLFGPPTHPVHLDHAFHFVYRLGPLAALTFICFACLPLAITFFYRGESLVNNHL
jgi:lipopolysaccharide transport system permease protein